MPLSRFDALREAYRHSTPLAAQWGVDPSPVAAPLGRRPASTFRLVGWRLLRHSLGSRSAANTSAGAPPSADVNWTLRVEGWMPGHGHGMLRQAVVDELGDGRYRVRGMLFHMPGLWELRVLVIETRMEEDYRVVEDDKVAIEVTL